MARATLIMQSMSLPTGANLEKQTMQFLRKLTLDDAAPGLHIEPMQNAADPRARTGRVNLQYRAVLFRLDGAAGLTYVFTGVWNHDEAIARAQSGKLVLNPYNGVAEIHYASGTGGGDGAGGPATPPGPMGPTLLGHSARELVDGLGIEEAFAERAARATTEDELLSAGEGAPSWQVLALIDLSSGMSLDEVRERYALGDQDERPEVDSSDDEQVIQGFRHPAAQMTFSYVAGQDDLQQAIENSTFAAWRVYLHPEQRRYASQNYQGPFRLSGGAGTGKTVVLVHRAARLARETPSARILLTTFTTNLAADLARSLRQLDPAVPQPERLHQPGVHVTGVDALASAVLRGAADELAEAQQAALGSSAGGVRGRPEPDAWRQAIENAGAELPPVLRVPSFFEAEYGLVILPQRLVDEAAYLKARRRGRGVRLNKAERKAVWRVVESYRLSARAAGCVSFVEAAAVAAAVLDLRAERGVRRLFDHVLIDEGQDLSPSHWQMVRALVADGPNDLFLAEDSHQRIYGSKITLGALGIRIVGRSRRLTLNYRTTRQNLAYALRILQPGAFQDLEEAKEDNGSYRSARGGPDVTTHPFENLSEELAGAAETVRGWVEAAKEAEGPLDSLAVLVRDQWDRDRLVKALAEKDVAAQAVDGKTAIRPGVPIVMTMHRAKGTEFSRVLLFNVSAGAMPKALKDYAFSEEEKADAVLRERSLLYVAATRARDQLAVSWNKEQSDLLPARDQ